MRTLLLFRGAPGCGKSTFIKNSGLENYTLSADSIRMMCCSPTLDASGNPQISQKRDKIVWNMLFQMLESRMQNGDFTVIDATNSKTEEMNRYKKLAEKYRYRISIVDMTNLPIEECKRRNASRAPLKQVPESVIDRMYSRFETQKIPSGITKLTLSDAIEKIRFFPADLNAYNKIHIIGDIHGCYSALMKLFDKIGGIKEDEFYIFCGDYIDRGIENAEVMNYLISIMDLPNVCFIEGNHERWLYSWSHDEKSLSREFERRTKYHLIKGNVDKKSVRQFYRKLRQCAYFEYGTPDSDSPKWIVTHAGISNNHVDSNLGLLSIPTSQMIYGVGEYQDVDKISASWAKLGWNQVFGHRNIQDFPTSMGNKCYDLEGNVEFGGFLRSITLSHDNPVECIEIKNDVYRTPNTEELSERTIKAIDVLDLVEAMRKSKDIQEKNYGRVSSFNFTKKAFEDRKWNHLTVRARGLFINTDKGSIVARGYEKFFRINEREETKIENLQCKLHFPVSAYVKENGALCLVSYDEETDDLFVASKSSIDSPFVENIRQTLESYIGPKGSEKYVALKAKLKDLGVTLAFEIIDPESDPHIIEYDSKHLVLLDAIRNKMAFQKLSYDYLCEIANMIGTPVKKSAGTFNTWGEFYSWYTNVIKPDYKFDGEYIEGFVIEDNTGYMVKVKTDYYSNWKFMRSVATHVNQLGYYHNTAALLTPEQNMFYGFLRSKHDESGAFDCNIIKLRKEFLSELTK